MRRRTVIAALLVLSLASLVICPTIGVKRISVLSVITGKLTDVESRIFWGFHLPRACTAFLAGSALALSGMALQALFRNPLATPFTLGVSSGASFGAVIYIIIGTAAGLQLRVLGGYGQSVFAFLGSVLAVLLVYGLTIARRGFSTATMLLAGVAISFFFSSLILFFQYMSDFTQSFRIIRWLMGELNVLGFGTVLNVLPFTVAGAVTLFFLRNELNLLMTGEEIAASRGVDTRTCKRLIFFATSLMVGGVVAICGPIGFVGMMAPHICRLMVGTDHRRLLPATMLFGGMFLTVCDTLARTLISPAKIPVGVITALLGGPFFIWLLLRGSSERRLL